MKRVLWSVFGGLALLAAAVLFQASAKGDAVARAELTPPSSVLPDVRVKHEFIAIPTTPPRTSLARRAERPKSAGTSRRQVSPTADTRPDVLRTANSTRAVEAPDQRDNLLIRAGRAVIGDGRYRPEPFPRIKKP